jgi:serine protease Do
MRKSRLLAMLTTLPLLAVASYAVECYSFEPYEQSWGYSSEDLGGGSYLGVDTRDVTSERLGDLKLKEEHGVEVTMVDQDAPAGKAGIKEHDVILSLNGNPVESVEQLRRMIREVPPERSVNLGLSRAGQPVTLRVQLADRKKAFAFSSHGDKDFKFAIPPIPPMVAMPAMQDMDLPVSVVVVHSAMRSGLMVENLTAQLGDFFGVKNAQGVLVRSVEKGSRADKAGFRAGDVIVKVNGQVVNDSGDFSHALRVPSDNTANVTVIRDKKEQTLTLTLPDRKQSGTLEESFDNIDIDVDADVRIAEQAAQSEIARVQPAIERATHEVERMRPEIERAEQQAEASAPIVAYANRQIELLRPELEQVQKELCNEQKVIKQKSGQMQHRLHKQQQEIEKQQKKLEHELRGEWTEI